MEAEAQGRRFSVLLQNAETVRLVRSRSVGETVGGGVGDGEGGGSGTPGSVPAASLSGGAISVSEVVPGDCIVAHLPVTVARHTGTAVEESIVEK